MGYINIPNVDIIEKWDFVFFALLVIIPWIITLVICAGLIIKVLLNIFSRVKSRDLTYYPLKNKSLLLDKLNIVFENDGTIMKIENMNKNKDVAVSYNCGSIHIYIIPFYYDITSKEKRITHYMVDRENIVSFTITRI
jgi:hypothetical protein